MAGGVVAPKMSGAAIVVAPHHKRRRQTRSRLLASVPRAIGATAEAAMAGLEAIAAGRTLIVATHDPVLAARMDRIVRLEALP